VCVQGPPGIGKTALISALFDRVALSQGTLLKVTCHPQVGEFEAYDPFLDLLALVKQQLRPSSRLRRWSGRAARKAVPDLLALVPALGCGCRKPCPHRSGGVLVFVEDAAESIVSSDVEVVESVRFGDQLGERA
jgi:predicted ATPase